MKCEDQQKVAQYPKEVHFIVWSTSVYTYMNDLVFADIMYYYITLSGGSVSSCVLCHVLFYMFHFWNKYNQKRSFHSLKFYNIQFLGHKQVGRNCLIWWAEFAHPLSVRRLGYCNTKQLIHFISTACGEIRQAWWRHSMSKFSWLESLHQATTWVALLKLVSAKTAGSGRCGCVAALHPSCCPSEW